MAALTMTTTATITTATAAAIMAATTNFIDINNQCIIFNDKYNTDNSICVKREGKVRIIQELDQHLHRLLAEKKSTEVTVVNLTIYMHRTVTYRRTRRDQSERQRTAYNTILVSLTSNNKKIVKAVVLNCVQPYCNILVKQRDPNNNRSRVELNNEVEKINACMESYFPVLTDFLTTAVAHLLFYHSTESESVLPVLRNNHCELQS